MAAERQLCPGAEPLFSRPVSPPRRQDLGPQGHRMSDKVRIALDAMGGDQGPAVVVAGADLALTRHPETEFLLFGNTALIAPLVDARPSLKAAAKLVHTDIAVRMEDKPSQALRYGHWKSSMWLTIDAVKKGDADVAVSGGNTGALMAMSKFNLKTLPGIDRPAIAALWPTLRGESVVLDVGASIGADADHLVDLAVMGAATARILFGHDRATVGRSMSKSTRAIALPIAARLTRCASSAPIEAPTSSTTDSPLSVGHNAAIAGRSMPSIILRLNRAIAISAPVFPAETATSASPFLTASMASHIDDFHRP